MTDFFEDFDLASDPLHILLILDLFLLKNFHGNLKLKLGINENSGYLLSCENVSRLLNLSKCAFPKCLA